MNIRDKEETCILCRRGAGKATDNMWGLSDIKMIELLQKIPRYLEHLFDFLPSNSRNSLLFTFPFCCLSCKKQIEKRQRLVVKIITVENDLLSRQFLDENFFRIAAGSIISLEERIAISKQSYSISEEEGTTTNMISVITIYLTVLANSSNHSRARCHNIKCK